MLAICSWCKKKHESRAMLDNMDMTTVVLPRHKCWGNPGRTTHVVCTCVREWMVTTIMLSRRRAPESKKRLALTKKKEWVMVAWFGLLTNTHVWWAWIGLPISLLQKLECTVTIRNYQASWDRSNPDSSPGPHLLPWWGSAGDLQHVCVKVNPIAASMQRPRFTMQTKVIHLW